MKFTVLAALAVAIVLFAIEAMPSEERAPSFGRGVYTEVEVRDAFGRHEFSLGAPRSREVIVNGESFPFLDLRVIGGTELENHNLSVVVDGVPTHFVATYARNVLTFDLGDFDGGFVCYNLEEGSRERGYTRICNPVGETVPRDLLLCQNVSKEELLGTARVSRVPLREARPRAEVRRLLVVRERCSIVPVFTPRPLPTR